MPCPPTTRHPACRRSPRPPSACPAPPVSSSPGAPPLRAPGGSAPARTEGAGDRGPSPPRRRRPTHASRSPRAADTSARHLAPVAIVHARSRSLPASSNGARSASASSSRPSATSASTSSGTMRKYAGSRTPIACSSSTALDRYASASAGRPRESSRNPRTARFGIWRRTSPASSATRSPSRAASLAGSARPRWASTRPTAKWPSDDNGAPHAVSLGGRPALPGVLHGCVPVARPAFQLGEVVPELRDRALDTVRRGITQELGERPPGLVQAIGELEELRHDEARTQDVGFELALHVPLQGDPAIEQLLIDPASEDELDERICLERFGHHPWVLQLLGQLQRGARVPFRCREVSPEQPGVPEVLLDRGPQREIVPRLAPSSLEHGPGAPPPFGLGDGHPQVQQHAAPSRPGHREVHRLLQDAPRQRGVPAFVSEPRPPGGSDAPGPHLGPAAWRGGPSPRARPRIAALPGRRPAGRPPRGRRRRRRPGLRRTAPGGGLAPPDRGRSSRAARAALGAEPAGSSDRRRMRGGDG